MKSLASLNDPQHLLGKLTFLLLVLYSFCMKITELRAMCSMQEESVHSYIFSPDVSAHFLWVIFQAHKIINEFHTLFTINGLKSKPKQKPDQNKKAIRNRKEYNCLSHSTQRWKMSGMLHQRNAEDRNRHLQKQEKTLLKHVYLCVVIVYMG